MERVSSNWTILLKFFIPIFYAVFFGSFVVAIWLNDRIFTAGIPLQTLRIGMLVVFLIGLTLWWFTLVQIKRVEMDEKFLFVTNYIKTVRYPWHQVEKISETDYLVAKVVRIKLKQKGIFGKKISFMASRYRFQEFLNAHPKVVKALMQKGGNGNDGK